MSLNKKLEIGLWLSATLLLLGMILPFPTAADRDNSADKDNNDRDLLVITELASEIMPSSASLMVHQGAVWQTYENQDEFEALFKKVIEQIAGHPPHDLPIHAKMTYNDKGQRVAGSGAYTYSTVHGRPAAEWTLQLHQAVQTVRMVGMNDGRTTYVTVRWEGVLGAAAEADKWQAAMAPRLSGLGIHEAWKTQVQGWLDDSADRDSVLHIVKREFQAGELDRYEDANSLSVSLSSKLLQQSVEAGGKEMHLQAALHRDTEVGKWRLTLAAPVILSEY
ncbi:YwmB family TATA-box binding protein [Paenibacillus senegalensis]|uniref:YwmB family TATA-box binding protein n=1 Tax=Paenibacillus senegalensis TaxID=1465766 RepID=UPI000288CDB3|nr:YwmB family TATA-box binding protein [Paenibacillus senegalensis]